MIHLYVTPIFDYWKYNNNASDQPLQLVKVFNLEHHALRNDRLIVDEVEDGDILCVRRVPST